MVCYFKRIETFETFGQAQVTEYSVPISSANGNTGKVYVVGELSQSYTRQWLILAGRLYYVTEVEPRDGMTEITVGDALTAFGRTLVYTEPTTNILGEWIKELAETEYAELADTAYDMPYLTATNSDTTEFAHVTPEEGLFSLESVMRDAQSRGIDISFSFTRTALTLTISPGDTTERVLVVGDGHTQLVSETYSRTAIAKVTVISELGYPHDYYLDVAGNISTTVPTNRAEGEWITVKQGEENLLDTATAAFAQNIESHKIELYSDVELPLYSSVVVRLKDKAYKTTVTYVGAFSKDSRFLYRCGELATTLTEKIESISHADINSHITRLSELINDTGFITSAEAPVQSVNGATGAVTLSQLTKGGSSVTSYPAATGLYAVTANIFSHMTPSTYYGTLIITATGNYQRHTFISADNEVYAGWGESATIAEPSAWAKLTTPSDFARTSAAPSGNVSCPNNTFTTICQITIPAGLQFIHANVHFAANNTGLREVIIANSDTGTSTISRYLHAIVAAAPGGDTVVNLSGFYPHGNQVTIYVRARQTSGAALNVTSYSGVEVVKIPT